MKLMCALVVAVAGLASSVMVEAPASAQPAAQPTPYSAPPADARDSADSLEPDEPAAQSQPSPDAPLPPVTTPEPTPEPTGAPPSGDLTAPSRPTAQFLTLDRYDGASRFVIDLAYTSFDSGDVTTIPLRFGLFGQYVSSSGLGGYGMLNVSLLKGEDDTSNALGNLEGGVVYATKLGTTDFVGRAGLVLPTAPKGDEVEAFITNAINSFSRIHDTALFSPGITWLRASGSPIWRRDNFLVRADVGVDVPLNYDEDIYEDYRFVPVLHAALGVAYLTNGHQLGVELVNTVIIDVEGEPQDDDEEEDNINNFHSLGVSYRYDLGKLSPFLGFAKLFSSDEIEELEFTFTGGVSGVFGQ